ncbi:chloramphenicol acetyltransferase [Maribacter sp. ANRC-HE7]|uniref:Chloramphenicol acetyltransferase n=1 Tax=Maribacter aquimaris TaxID=2737171 RepID=A0ABR7UYV6_9FLAO|nr:chloramphenicol acetyltransferase [Maribacter aquimaris]MBD0776211.1 chloramphenicol acetyltransferase [Maribacter aquimaris]
MKKVDFSNPHRKKHFDFFREMNHPHFNVTANVDISILLPFLKDHKFPINIGMVYLLARTANEIPEFRWRIRGDEVVEHPLAHPSFTVSTDVADVFSFCSVDFSYDSNVFFDKASTIMENMKTNPSLEDEIGRDDFLFMSTFPWVSFTSIQHAMHYHPSDSVPRIVWGKFFEQDGKTWMPLSVQAHHAIVDGRHIGQFFQDFEAMASAASDFL